jgi:4,5-DOPA dioxygenase extradiol
MTPLPPVFVSHGSPLLLLDPGATGAAWQRLAAGLPRPRAILAVSAHWTAPAPTVGAAPQPATIHDFYGFPDPLYEIGYPAPGSPELAARVTSLIPGVRVDPQRGLDHGAWSPLSLMYPDADIPVCQFAVMPGADASAHFELGRCLAPLVREGVLVFASGSLTHNLGEMVPGAPENAAQPHVAEFSDWFAARLAAGRAGKDQAQGRLHPHHLRHAHHHGAPAGLLLRSRASTSKSSRPPAGR